MYLDCVSSFDDCFTKMPKAVLFGIDAGFFFSMPVYMSIHSGSLQFIHSLENDLIVLFSLSLHQCLHQKSEAEKKLSSCTSQEVTTSMESDILVKHLQEELRNYVSFVSHALFPSYLAS